MDIFKKPRYRHLLKATIWQSNLDDINNILSMSEWDTGLYDQLLSPSIWKKSTNDIRLILQIAELQDDKYNQLLSPSIFCIKASDIVGMLKLAEEYGLDAVISNRFLRRDVNQQRVLIQYLLSHDIELVLDKTNGEQKMNPILTTSNGDLKQTYGIDISALSRKK